MLRFHFFFLLSRKLHSTLPFCQCFCSWCANSCYFCSYIIFVFSPFESSCPTHRCVLSFGCLNLFALVCELLAANANRQWHTKYYLISLLSHNIAQKSSFRPKVCSAQFTNTIILLVIVCLLVRWMCLCVKWLRHGLWRTDNNHNVQWRGGWETVCSVRIYTYRSVRLIENFKLVEWKIHNNPKSIHTRV